MGYTKTHGVEVYKNARSKDIQKSYTLGTERGECCLDISECHLCPRNCGANRNINLSRPGGESSAREEKGKNPGGESSAREEKGKNPCGESSVRAEKRKYGFCGESGTIRISRAALHVWEEPVVSGTRGSGTVFFTGCNLRCIFCQNAAISEGGSGREVSAGELADIFVSLEAQGAHNINLVTPTHFIPGICEAIAIAKTRGLSLPFVYNTSGYESVESLRMLDGLIDVYLPDFKYMDVRKAAAYSNAPDYPEVAKKAIAEMFRQVGKPVIEGEGAGGEEKKNCENEKDSAGGEEKKDCENEKDGAGAAEKGTCGAAKEGAALIKKGLIVRHLVLPLGVKNACAVADYLAEEYGDSIYVSIMNQYTPLYDAPGALREEQRKRLEPYGELHRKVTKREYDRVVEHCLELGLTNVFIQEDDASGADFIPDWNE